MKVIKQENNHLFFIGKDAKCRCCGSIIELEEEDLNKLRLSTFEGFRNEKRISGSRRAYFQCPVCGDHLGVREEY